MARLCTIYALSDPRLERVFENVRYVGKTNGSLEARLSGHITRKDTCYKRSWIANLEKDGVLPLIWPLAFCCEDNWQRIESEWISRLRKIAHLTNLTDGGDGNTGRKWTDEQRAKASASRKGSIVSPEHRLKLSLSGRGKKKPPFTARQLQLMREAKLGKKLSPEHREKLRLANTGRVHTWGAKISASLIRFHENNPS